MKQFNITYLDGIQEGVRAVDIGNAILFAKNPSHSEMVKVECIDKQILRHQIKQVNEAFYDAGKKYWDNLSDMHYMVCHTLAKHGFDDVSETFNPTGVEGAARAIPIGKGVFLCVTWYQLQSKRFEFVGYIS